MDTSEENDIKYPIYSGPLFPCDFCMTFFISYDFLTKHKKKCSDMHIMTLLKSQLQLTSSRRKGLKRKVKCERSSQDAIACELCFVELNNPEDYEQHIKLHEEEMYAENKLPISLDKDFIKTLQNKLREKMFKKNCDICGLTFNKVTEYKKHMASHKEEKQQKKASPVDSALSQKLNDLLHMKIKQNSEMKYECTVCLKAFEEKANLVKHLKIHSEMRPFICLECEKNFKFLGDLNRHYKKVHNKKLKFKCDECDRSFFTKAMLVTHGAMVHNHEKPYKCDQCDKTFCSDTGLENHKITHTGQKPFQCPECQKCFTQKGALHLHISSVHKKEKLFQCDICFKSFSQKANLKLHEIIHTGEKPYKCNECGKSYRQNGDLKKHIIIVHKQEKSFQCPICPKCFSLKSILMKHMITHTDDKPFNCTECERTFKEKDSLQKHIKFVHHKVRPVKCLLCEKGFTNKPSLEIHIKTVHKKERNFLCEVCSKTFGQKSSLMTHKKLHCPT